MEHLAIVLPKPCGKVEKTNHPRLVPSEKMAMIFFLNPKATITGKGKRPTQITLPKTNISPLKISQNYPQKETIVFKPSIFSGKLAVSFREVVQHIAMKHSSGFHHLGPRLDPSRFEGPPLHPYLRQGRGPSHEENSEPKNRPRLSEPNLHSIKNWMGPYPNGPLSS